MKIAVIGLGYVGLPLSLCLAKKFTVLGYDINCRRIEELSNGLDITGEIESEILSSSKIVFTAEETNLSDQDIFIITVPTPIDDNKKPNLNPICDASRLVGKYLKKGSIVVYESTVYPGVTEEVCVPILEEESGLCWLKDFNVGYSPERINPGDKDRSIDKIIKVVSGDCEATLKALSQLYGSVITAGIHKAPTIKTAEAAKVIENTQRDLNIALMNELSIIFGKLGISTRDVLEAAQTKWNFLPFFPGLVGGHCIGVDPYYLTYKAESKGYHPQVVLAGRRINDDMGFYVARRVIKSLVQRTHLERVSFKVLICGLTFKENVSDIRNTKVIDIYKELEEYGVDVHVYDPIACPKAVKKEYDIQIMEKLNTVSDYDGLILAVKHNIFKELLSVGKLLNQKKDLHVFDIPGFYNRLDFNNSKIKYWSL